MAPRARAPSSLFEDEVLATALQAVVARRHLQQVSIALVDATTRVFASVDSTTGPRVSRSACVTPAPVGCLAKLITAWLIRRAVAQGKLRLGDSVSGILNLPRAARRRIAGVTVRHLIDHKHGLDASLLRAIPRRPGGFIDAAAICAGIATRRLCAPGEFYSYGEVGPWLAGAVLENLHGRTYGELLLEEPWFPGDLRGLSPENICPATGEQLQLSCAHWLEFLRLHFTPQVRPDEAAALIEPLSGWSLFEKGVSRGWKNYGGGWLGHNSYLSDSSTVLRVQPIEQIGIIVSVPANGAAAQVLADVMGAGLPEFADLAIPRPLLQGGNTCFATAPCSGRYIRADSEVTIRLDEGGALLMSVYDRVEMCAAPPMTLLPAEFGLFMPMPPGHPSFPVVQFLKNGASGGSEYIWNGRELWRREPRLRCASS